MGSLNVVNAFLPLIIWNWIVAPTYENMNTNKIYLYAWYGMQGGHLLAYSLQSLLWPFIYLDKMWFIRALFAYAWTYLGQGLGIAVAAGTTITLLASSYAYNKYGDRDDLGDDLLELTDIWSTQIMYLFFQTIVFYVSNLFAPGAMRYVGYDTELGHDFDKDGVYGNT